MLALACPFPCQKRAAFLNANLKTKLKESLDYLVTLNRNALGAYYPTWQQSLSSIQTQRKISSFYYSLNSLLVQETTADAESEQLGHVSAIASYINALPLKPVWDKSIADGGLHFSSFEENPDKNHLTIDEFNRSRIQSKYILFDLPINAEIHTPDKESVERIKELAMEAIQLISETDIEYYQEMSEFLCEVLVLKSDFLKAGSSFNLFGLVYINTANAKQSVINMMDLFIHEAAHYYLYSLSIDDPLVLNDYNEKYFSPIKGRERPMLGVYHAAFVLFRVLKFLSHFSSIGEESKKSLIAYHYLLNKNEIMALQIKYSKIVEESLNIVMEFGQLTALGAELIKATQKEFIGLKTLFCESTTKVY